MDPGTCDSKGQKPGRCAALGEVRDSGAVPWKHSWALDPLPRGTAARSQRRVALRGQVHASVFQN